MTQRGSAFVWQKPAWPRWTWDGAALLDPMSRARRSQGELLGKAGALGFDLDLSAEILTREAVETSAIEGERLDPASVRSSVAKRLGLSAAGLPPPQRSVEGLVEMLLDATARADEPLTADRLKRWQAGLFPTGYSGAEKIVVGAYRPGPEPMAVVSGVPGAERIHYEAPPAPRVDAEMEALLAWWTASRGTVDGLVRAGLAHLWFVTIHPFEDGNGRVARALTDLALAQDEGTKLRLYGMSAQLHAERAAYYEVLERTQRGDGDATEWLSWFLDALRRSVASSDALLERSLETGRFWTAHADVPLGERQRKVVNRLLETGAGGFEGGLSRSKYAGMTHTSPATAQRDLAELVERGVLVAVGGGRSTRYELAWHRRPKSWAAAGPA